MAERMLELLALEDQVESSARTPVEAGARVKFEDDPATALPSAPLSKRRTTSLPVGFHRTKDEKNGQDSSLMPIAAPVRKHHSLSPKNEEGSALRRQSSLGPERQRRATEEQDTNRFWLF